MSTEKKLSLELLPDCLAVCALPPDSPFPQWALAGGMLSLTRTHDELSIVCSEQLVPLDVKAERGWRALQVAGPLDFSLVGILSAIASPLAQSGISIFALSTYQTDYVLVKESSLRQAVDALVQAGFVVENNVILST